MSELKKKSLIEDSDMDKNDFYVFMEIANVAWNWILTPIWSMGNNIF